MACCLFQAIQDMQPQNKISFIDSLSSAFGKLEHSAENCKDRASIFLVSFLMLWNELLIFMLYVSSHLGEYYTFLYNSLWTKRLSCQPSSVSM